MARGGARYITAEHPERGTLWACVDGSCVYPEGKIAERRFGAFLTPFRSEDAARAALASEGAQA